MDRSNTVSAILDPTTPERRTSDHTTLEARTRQSRTRQARTRGTYRRRRALVLVGLVLAVFALAMLMERADAQAELDQPVAGHVVAEPGSTLWDIAAATAPAGVDTRQQLASLRELNGIDGSHLDTWAVVLIPAR